MRMRVCFVAGVAACALGLLLGGKRAEASVVAPSVYEFSGSFTSTVSLENTYALFGQFSLESAIAIGTVSANVTTSYSGPVNAYSFASATTTIAGVYTDANAQAHAVIGLTSNPNADFSTVFGGVSEADFIGYLTSGDYSDAISTLANAPAYLPQGTIGGGPVSYTLYEFTGPTDVGGGTARLDSPSPTPEPSTFVLASMGGLLGLGSYVLRRRSRA